MGKPRLGRGAGSRALADRGAGLPAGLSWLAHAAPGLSAFIFPVPASQLTPRTSSYIANRVSSPPYSSESQGSSSGPRAAPAGERPQQVSGPSRWAPGTRSPSPIGLALGCAVLCFTKLANKKCLLCAGSHVVLSTAALLGPCRPHLQVADGGLKPVVTRRHMIPRSLVGPLRTWDWPRPGGLLLWQGPWLWMADPWAIPLQGPSLAGLLLPRGGAQRAGVRSISPCAQMREPRRRGCCGAVLRADGHPPATVT